MFLNMSDAIARLNTALEGRYHIERQLGEGGMATVYLADDVKHERKVALKVLKPELAAVVGADRFLGEIKTTANLQHPHILPLFDSGEADGFLFYAMPFIDGETLRDRLDREKQLPIEEAVRIASDVAEALHAAHEQGVIHRDIKPANILLSRGRPLVSDFGIALAITAAGGGRMTETGLSLGTPHYMSPEQATGDRHVGPTTDVYALGCVLYEMLVGEPPYTGSTAQAVLGRIIAGELEAATEQRASIPVHVDAAIRKALEKVPADRFSRAQDFLEALADPAFRHGAAHIAGAASGGPWKRLSTVATATAVLLGLAAVWGWLRPIPSRSAPVPLHAALLFPPDSGPSDRGGYTISPDGKELAFATLPRLDGGRIWIRAMETGQRRVLEGTEGAEDLAWSPTGDRIAYRLGNSEIRVVPSGGGPVTTVARIENGIGRPSWAEDGSRLLFIAEGGVWGALEGARAPGLVVPTERQFGILNTFVEPLPDGRRFLLASYGPSGPGIFVGDFATHELTLLVERAGNPRYEDGWLLFMRPEADGDLMAQRFDPESVRLLGAPVTIAVGVWAPGGNAEMAIRDNTLVFSNRADGGGDLAWLDAGRGSAVRLPETMSTPGWQNALSADGTRIATGGWGLWVTESGGGLPRRIEGARNRAFGPRWSPDGNRILYMATDGLRAIGTTPGDSSILIAAGTPSAPVLPVGLGPEGEVLYIEFHGDGSSNLKARDDGGRGEVRTVQPGAIEAAISPDGAWLAYVSAQGGGDPQVIVRPYRGGQEQRISSDGGSGPAWSPSGDAVYFVTPRGGVKVVSLTFEGPTRASPPRDIPVDVPVRRVMPHPDGRLLLEVGSGALEYVNVLRDWQTIGGGGG
jgi:Tol biopolymer transport system component